MLDLVLRSEHADSDPIARPDPRCRCRLEADDSVQGAREPALAVASLC